ncbi:lipid A-modifier LpxR family protein [Albidovulum sp.]|uniref:lipid A-modifier LpxR family protein n=1 Tax=Albidovulum sp. TaxID=1872424 RepID=UPI0039B94D9E
MSRLTQRAVACVLALTAIYMLIAIQAAAETPNTISVGRLFNNDFLGDGEDRWRTGSYVISKVVTDRNGNGLPNNPGRLLEWRLRSEIIAPANTASPAPGDRRYVGSLSVGLHTHYVRAGWETSFGLDLVATGPSTHVSDFHKAVHNLIGQPVDAAVASQIGNRLHPTVLVEFGRVMTPSDNIAVRPFIEAQAGVENFARAGFDVTVGDQCQGELRIRDVVTGHRYRAMPCDANTPALLLGMDTAHIFDSRYLPSGQGYELTGRRTRLRAGVELRTQRAYVFYGLTYLDREFESQDEGQIVGSLNVGFNF